MKVKVINKQVALVRHWLIWTWVITVDGKVQTFDKGGTPTKTKRMKP